ncbi:MAG: PH domain-containing protein [Anaerolineales bacterium]|nr:PH domain-containing protein [Anaerolineales bacterium]
MNDSDEKVFTPELAPRTGERNAWILAFLMVILWLVFRLTPWELPVTVEVLVIFTLGAALLISFSNWVERKTILAIHSGGVRFENGIRKVHLGWKEIEEVRVRPAVWGKRVQVRGKGTRFDFFTLGEVKYKGAVQAKTGFAQGEEIVRQIVLNSGLRIADQLGDELIYSR